MDNKDLMAFGNHLKKIRESNSISQEKLALAADSYQSTVIRIEKGQSNPKLTTIIALAKALKIPLKELTDF